MKKRIVCVAMCLIMVLSLAACSKSEGKDSKNKKYQIGICQLVQHNALDAATKGFRDAVTEALGEDSVSFDEQNASGDSTNCATIVNGFKAANVDLIMANATLALQAAAAATDTIPIIGTSISAYSAALELSDFNGVVGGNISGTSDLAPLKDQAALVREWFPTAKKVGILYCSAEDNSVFQVETIIPELEALGFECTRFSFTDTNDIAGVTQTACDKSDVIYVPTDNMVASNAEAVANICIPAKVPVVAGEENICAACGVCTLSIDYYEIGHIAGEMAAKVLKGEEKIENMAVQYAPNVTKKYNAEICQQLGITVPAGYTAITR